MRRLVLNISFPWRHHVLSHFSLFQQCVRPPTVSNKTEHCGLFLPSRFRGGCTEYCLSRYKSFYTENWVNVPTVMSLVEVVAFIIYGAIVEDEVGIKRTYTQIIWCTLLCFDFILKSYWSHLYYLAIFFRFFFFNVTRAIALISSAGVCNWKTICHFKHDFVIVKWFLRWITPVAVARLISEEFNVKPIP